MQSTLVLNATFEPIHTDSSRKAISKIINGKAISLMDSDRTLSYADGEVPVPYVIMLTKQAPYHAYKQLKRRSVFSMKSVLLRDKYTCAYCEGPAQTVDHVLPKALGGKSTYENCVAACSKCNSKKGSKTLQEMGWKLHFVPGIPGPWSIGSPYQSLARKAPNKSVLKLWLPYLSKFDTKVEALV